MSKTDEDFICPGCNKEIVEGDEWEDCPHCSRDFHSDCLEDHYEPCREQYEEEDED